MPPNPNQVQNFSTRMGRRGQGAQPRPAGAANRQQAPMANFGSTPPMGNVSSPRGGEVPAAMNMRGTPRPTQSGQPSGGGPPSLPRSPYMVLQDILGQPGYTPLRPNQVNNPMRLFVDRFNQANQMNDARYQQALQLMAGQGQASRAEAVRMRDEAVGGDVQSLISRGLGGTTVVDSLRAQRDRDLQQAHQSIDENVASNLAGIVERRTDQAPDLGMFLELLRQQSEADARDQAGNRRTRATIFGPRGPNSFIEQANSGAGGGGSGGGGGGSGGGSRGGGHSRTGNVGTYTNPNARPGEVIRPYGEVRGGSNIMLGLGGWTPTSGSSRRPTGMLAGRR